MTPLPSDLEPFREQAKSLIEDGHVHALEFSGRTYQVNVFDPDLNESFWAFLHLTEPGEISDCFCLCSDENESDRCAHLAAGMMKIFNGKAEPLHKRYEESFWRGLGMILDQRGKKGSKAYFKAKNKKGEAFLKELFEKDVLPTEESSLKFSDLTEEEIKGLRQGKINAKLHYEFSYFSDLAKTFLIDQENKHPPKVFFQEEASGLPLGLTIETALFIFSIQLTKDELEALIPLLITIDSPLRARGGFADLIAKAHFDPGTGSLILSRSEFDIKKIKGIEVGNWIYQSGKGFFRVEGDTSLMKGAILPKEMEAFLNRYHRKLGSLLHPGIFERKGHLKFDKEGRLHLTHYLFSPGDLSTKKSWTFGDWVWIPEKGFYKTLLTKDLPKEAVIKQDRVYEWIVTHQGYLAGIAGFKVHLKEMESTITWKVNDDGVLSFKSNLKGDFEGKLKEYGSFVYVKGEGFFSKTSIKEALAIQAGLHIPRSKVSSYIHLNEQELRLIPNFFIRKNPIEKAGIKLTLQEGRVVAIPIIELIEEYRHHIFRIYDDYLYVKNEGFYHFPEKNFIPHEWRDERVIPNAELSDFFGKKLEKLAPFIKDIDPRLDRQKIRLTYHDGLYWESNGAKLPFEEFLKAYRSGKRFYFSSVGRIDFHEERLQTLGKLFKESRYPELTLMEVLKLKAIEEIDLNLDKFKKSRPLDISGLKSTLRPYQEIGLKWLWSLYCNNLSGLLCDDMGLGKTHQAMALMAACRNDSKKPLRFLVICPTSVLYHWQEKMQQFMPGLNVVVYHGLKRSLKEFGAGEGVLLTSYGVLRNEIKSLKEFSFDIAIYDEVQVAKNHQSRLWVALKEIKANMVLGLTGTPIENHLRELKSLFDIVLPTLMPSEADFVRLFVKPIEREESLAAKALLHRYIEPFLLRRKKEEVLFDLPEKIEEISHTDLLPSQKKLYQEIYQLAKESVLPELIDNNRVIPYIHIFALLSSLKKICDHPALYLKNVGEYQKYESGKWELFVELLNEALGSEQKVVVFSHFLGMLDIIESHLTQEGIGFASLRGSTPNRREMIEKFQKDPECKVFVASLQAGGLGIDLTSASVVIHYDRWWNAARENQATDRVHRIGQTRGVQVFKLVTVGTVEDRIHALIEKKRKRMEEIVGGDEAQVIKTLTRDELIEIFQDPDSSIEISNQ